MAKYRIGEDGHPYLRHGYVVLSETGEDHRFSTYQFHPRAEKLFEEADFPEGGTVPPEVFYALLIEGNLYNDALPRGIGLDSIPYEVRDKAAQLLPIAAIIPKVQPRPEYVLDVYRELAKMTEEDGPGNVARNRQVMLSIAAWISLALRVKQGDSQEAR